MTQWAGISSDGRAKGVLELYTISQDPTNNRSLIRHAGGMFDNDPTRGGSGSDGYYNFYWNGGLENSVSGVSYNFAGTEPGWLQIHDHWVSHDANGVGPTVSGQWTWGVAFSPYYTNGVDTGVHTWQPASFSGPSAPTNAPSFDRVSGYTSISFSGAGYTSYGSMGSIQRYEYQYSTDNSTWSGAVSTAGTNGGTLSGIAATQQYYLRTRAVSNASYNWGYGPWSASVLVPGVPAAPAIDAPSVSGLSVTVTCSASATNGGAAITGYFVQYRSSTDGGGTWSAWGNTQTMTSRSYTYASLTPGTTYQFRTYSTNVIGGTSNTTGVSAYSTQSGTTFISAYGKRSQTKAVTGVTAVGSTTTYTSSGHGFSVGDSVTVSGITPGTLNASGTVTATTSGSFTLGSTTPATTSGTYSSGGSATGYAKVLTGQRYDLAAAQWVPIGTAKKYVSGTGWVNFQ